MAASIKALGVLQPILVRPKGKKYEIIFGERRYKAVVLAGLSEIPANVRELSDEDAMDMAITENLQRQDISPIEEANAFQSLIGSKRYDVMSLVLKFGKSDTYIRGRLKLNDLVTDFKDLLLLDEVNISIALELVKYSQEIQQDIYNRHFTDDDYSNWRGLNVSKLAKNIENGYTTNLERYFFDKTACLGCPFNSSNFSLFGAENSEGKCSKNDCLHQKNVEYLTAQADSIIEKNPWINVVNPFRASTVLGTPGSGKSYAVVNSFIKQQIEKGFAMYVYDFKFPDLSVIAYNHLLNNREGYKKAPTFYVINFDDPSRSHRCNPINPSFMTDISDAYESAYTIMLNLNRTWVQKQGDFFVESPIILFAAIIWYLRIYKDGKYCTFPHAIEFLNKRYEDIFPILTSYPDLENYLSPFMDAWLGGAADQLMGQIASAKIPLSRMISPQLYWVMSGDEFTLDINNPDDPKVLVVGNNPDRQNIYGAALGLYNSRIVKLINKKGRLKSSVIIDELPTIFFKGLDNLIATARSNKVAVLLGFQDFSQLMRDYGDKEAKVVMNTVGNIFSGQVVGDTAKTLSDRFGKVLQKRQSMTINRNDKSTSISTQLDSLIPASKISNLTQGMFVGAVADNFEERIEQKIFHAEIVVDNARVAAETKKYKEIPVITNFVDENGIDRMKEQIQENYNRIKAETKQIVEAELTRIKDDPELCKLLPKQEE